MRKLIFRISLLIFFIVMFILLFFVDFSHDATNIYFNTVHEIIQNGYPVFVKNIVYLLNCILGMIVNINILSECKEDLCNSLDNVFIGIKYIIDFLGWMFSNILKKLFLY